MDLSEKKDLSLFSTVMRSDGTSLYITRQVSPSVFIATYFASKLLYVSTFVADSTDFEAFYFWDGTPLLMSNCNWNYKCNCAGIKMAQEKQLLLNIFPPLKQSVSKSPLSPYFVQLLTLKTKLGSLHLINTCQIIKILERSLLKMFIDSAMQKKMAHSAMSSLIQWTTSSVTSILALPSHQYQNSTWVF